jgi:hypothetical protein
MANYYGPAQDGILAMISVLSVMFLVLFMSCAYFLTYRAEVVAQEAYVTTELARIRQQVPSVPNVAGYQTDYDPQYIDLETLDF